MAILSARLAVICLLATACGNPLVDGTYLGEPLYSFRGKINDFRFEDQRGLDRYRASIFWSLTGETSTIAAELVEQKSIAISNIFPPDVEIILYNPPSGVGLERITAPYYLGMIYLYEDVDSDEEMDPGELRGGANINVLFWAKRDLSAQESPSRMNIPAGYSLQELPLPCDSIIPVARATLEENCGVELGSRCETDEECGAGGKCGDTNLPGQCIVPYDPTGCVPKQGAYYPPEIYQGMFYPAEGWFVACDNDNDCPPGQDLACRFYSFEDPSGNYVGACVGLKSEPAQIDIFEEFSCVVSPLCFRDDPEMTMVAPGMLCGP
jgi:hypothetical protein